MSIGNPLSVLFKEIDGSKVTTDIYLPTVELSTPTKFPVCECRGSAAFEASNVKQLHADHCIRQHLDVLKCLMVMKRLKTHANRFIVINIHGGAFMLGHSRMVSFPQIEDCLERGWIVVVPNPRLCPGVNLLNGPMEDIRDLLAWIYDGSLDKFLSEQGNHRADLENVAAFGTSSGGHLALSLGFNAPRKPKVILDFYGAVSFSSPAWSNPLPHIAAIIPPLEESFINKIYDEYPVPTDSSVSLEGQSETGASKGPNFSQPRDAFAFTQISTGKVINKIYPDGDAGGSDPEYKLVDPVKNISSEFPPTYIVHGAADTMVPIDFSRTLYKRLQEEGVECGMTEVPGEEHTFAMKMAVGSETWKLQQKGFDFVEKYIGRGPV